METKELLETIEKVIPAIDTKGLVEQTNHLIFSDGLLAAYNGKISISTPVDLDFECSVPAQDLLKVVKSIDDKEMEITLEDEILHIVSDNVRAALSTDIEEEAALKAIRKFELDDLYDEKGAEVPENFIMGLELCQYSASRNADDMQNLNCILANGNTMTAGDGYRCTFIELDVEMDKMLIPASSASNLTKFDPLQYIISGGWVHMIDSFDTVFSFIMTKGDFPDIARVIDSFEADLSVDLPDGLRDVAHDLGNITDSHLESFRILEVNICDEEIECFIEKTGVSVTKTIPFEGNEIGASFMINSVMLASILAQTNTMELSEKFALFSDETFKCLIGLVES